LNGLSDLNFFTSSWNCESSSELLDEIVTLFLHQLGIVGISFVCYVLIITDLSLFAYECVQLCQLV